MKKMEISAWWPTGKCGPSDLSGVVRYRSYWDERFLRFVLPCLFVMACASSWHPAQAQASGLPQAESLVRQHQWDAGLALLLPLLKNDPDNLRLINLTALAFTGKGDIAQADEYFERALKIDSGFLPALKNLAVNEFNAGNYPDAERRLSLALKQAPGDPVINLYLGEAAYKRKDFATVVATLPNAQSFFARDANIPADLAVSYLTLNKPQEAIGLLPQAPPAALNPSSQFTLGTKLAGAGLFDSAVPYLAAARLAQPGSMPGSLDVDYDLALCYLELKRYPEAITVLREGIAGGKETSELDNMLAEAFEGDHQTQTAIDTLRRAIALAPDDTDNYLDFASICIDHQDYPAALKVIQAGLQARPNADRLYFERAILYAVQDNFQPAEEDFKRAAALSPEKDSNYKGLGILYLESGKGAQAVATLKQRLKSTPDNPDLLYLLGEALLRSGAQPGDAQYKEAQASFERSVKLDPAPCLPHVSLGKMYLEQGRVEDAVSQLERARASDPKEKSTYWQLALAYRKLGEPDKQKEVLLSLKKLDDEQRTGTRGRASVADSSAQAPEAKSN